MMLGLPEAVRLIQKGEIVAIPTEAVYGLSVNPACEQAVHKLLTLKTRAPEKGLILVTHRLAVLEAWVAWADLPSSRVELIRASWPGPVTWVLPVLPTVSKLLTGERSTVAVRVTAHPVLSELCRCWGGALVSTSANPTGFAPAKSPAEVRAYFGALFPIVSGDLGGSLNPTQMKDGVTGEQIR